MYMLQILKLPIAKTNTLTLVVYIRMCFYQKSLFQVKHEILTSGYRKWPTFSKQYIACITLTCQKYFGSNLKVFSL